MCLDMATTAAQYKVDRTPGAEIDDAPHSTGLAIREREAVEDPRERYRGRHELERTLKEARNSEAWLRKIIDTIPAQAYCNLPDGTNEFSNQRWQDYTGQSSEESSGWGWQAAYHPEDLPRTMEKWRALLAAGEPGEIQARLRRHDGVYRWFLFRCEPLRDESGKIVRWYGVNTDIDDLKRTEEKLREDEREGIAHVHTSDTLLEMSVTALNAPEPVTYDDLYDVGFLGHGVLYNIAYVMARDIVESDGPQRLTLLLKQPPYNFVLSYAQLATYGADKDHARLGPNTIAAAKHMADGCKEPSF